MANSKVIPVRFDAPTWELIQRVAQACGRTASGYLRFVATQAAQRDDRSHPLIRAERRRMETVESGSAGKKRKKTLT